MTEKNNIKASLLADDLASLESYIHDLFYFSSIPVCFISPIGVLLEVNPAFETCSEFRSYELIGEGVEKLFDKGEIGKISKETLKKGFVKEREATVFTKKGKEITALIFSRVRRDERGEVVGFFLSFFDLTKIKNKEKKLKTEIKKLKEQLKKSKK